MALTNNQNEKRSEDETKNIWSEILTDVQSSSASKLPSCRQILVLGDAESGKTTLVSKLKGSEEIPRGSGLEYHTINVKDEIRDDVTQLGVWIADGNTSHTSLLQFALTEESFPHTLVVLVVSMANPWTILESLRRWATILEEHIERLKLPIEDQREYEESLVRYFQEYSEPDIDDSTSHKSRGSNPLHPRASEKDREKVLLPLGETTLKTNLGIPIVAVVTKTDTITSLEKDYEYRDEHFDFIQQHIRKFCLNYGASLFYTSVKEDKNCDLLYRYLLHRIYGFPFNTMAFLVERDSVFVPSGWDNLKKISILYENMTAMKEEDQFEEIITKPSTRKAIQREMETVAVDDQVFLMKLQTNLGKVLPTKQDSPTRSSHNLTSKSLRSSGASPTAAAAMATPKKGVEGASSEGVLANFFNSLLSKRSVGVSPNAQSPSSASPKSRLERSTGSVQNDVAGNPAVKVAPAQNSSPVSNNTES